MPEQCRKCRKVFGDEHNLATIEEHGLCALDNLDNDRREHVRADIDSDQADEIEAIA